MNLSGLNILTIVLWVGLIIYGLYRLYRFFEGRRASKSLESDEFRQDMRKVQVIDIRETPEFEAGHILGARNIAYTQFKDRYREIRKDQPVYLYDQRNVLTGRAAARLKKAGYTNIYTLKGGYDKWNGKIKKGR